MKNVSVWTSCLPVAYLRTGVCCIRGLQRHLQVKNLTDDEATFVQGRKDFWKPFKPCHVGIHWIALAEYSQMSTHLPGFQLFFVFFVHGFVLAKLATIDIRVKYHLCLTLAKIKCQILQMNEYQCMRVLVNWIFHCSDRISHQQWRGYDKCLWGQLHYRVLWHCPVTNHPPQMDMLSYRADYYSNTNPIIIVDTVEGGGLLLLSSPAADPTQWPYPCHLLWIDDR